MQIAAVPPQLLFFFCIPYHFPGCVAKHVLGMMIHDGFNVSRTVIEQFERRNDTRVEFFKSGNTGAALVQAILAGNAP